jgi:DNA polymerase-3 subunit delta
MSTPARITLIRGGETALADRATAVAVDAIRKETSGADRTVLDASADDGADALRYACAPTLFGDDVIVQVTNLQSGDDSFAAALAEVLADHPDHVYLIVMHDGTAGGKKLLEALREAGAQEVECKAVKKGKPAIEVLTKEFTRHRRHATADAVHVLYEAVGHDLPMLFAAVSQLVADVPDDPITEDHVRDYFAGVADVAGWKIAEQVWQRRPSGALESVRYAVASGNENSVGLTSVLALASALRDIIRVGGMGPGASDADVAREVGLAPWQVSKVRAQWSRWSGDQRRLAASLVDLADAEAMMKGGLKPGQSLDVEQKLYALERLVVESSAR